MSKLEVEILPESLHQIQIKAAEILASMGYRKNSPVRLGAIKLAALECKVTERTIHYWSDNPEFIAVVEAKKAAFLAAGTLGLLKAAKNGNAFAANRLCEAIDPKVWDSERRRQKALKRLEMRLRREYELNMQDKAPDLPVPTYIDTSQTQDPDEGQRPKGYDDFRPIPETP